MSLEKKKCPEGKILNPVTKRCVNENGKIGKQIKEGKVKISLKRCPEGKILNPKTGYCVDKNGKIGKTIKQESKSKTPQKKSKRKTRKSVSLSPSKTPKKKSKSRRKKSKSISVSVSPPKTKSKSKSSSVSPIYKTKPGKVYIASMNLRGKWANAPKDAIKVNVTSAQGKNNKNRRDFSPMTFIPSLYKGYANFESFWQSGKVFEGIDVKKVKNFWKNVSEKTGPKRRFPGSKGIKVLYSKFNGEKMDYITSRKKVYVPLYFDLMKHKEMALFWKKEVENGNDVVVYDFDGPRLDNGEVTCIEITIDKLKQKINDTRFPFGHGYVVAAYLKNIYPDEYI